MTTPNFLSKTTTGYRCVICNQDFSGAFARHDAKLCCASSKPRSQKALRDALNVLTGTYSRIPMPRLDKPAGDGTVRRDQWRHFRRGGITLAGAVSPAQITAEYHKEQERIKRTMDMIKINKLIPVYGEAVAHAFGDQWHRRRRRVSKRQRAAYRALNPYPYAGGGSAIAARIAVARVDDHREVLLDNKLQGYDLVRSWRE